MTDQEIIANLAKAPGDQPRVNEKEAIRLYRMFDAILAKGSRK